MLHLIPIAKGAVTLTAIPVLGVMVSVVTDEISSGTLSEHTPITLGTAIAILFFCVSGAWYLSAVYSKITGNQKAIKENQVAILGRLHRIETHLKIQSAQDD